VVFFLLFGLNHWAFANQIDIGIFESSAPNTIEIRIRPDFTINDNQTISGIIYTVRWNDPTIVITTINNIEPYLVLPMGPPVLDNGYYYQIFGSTPMNPVGTAIPAGTERVISSFSYTGSDGAFFEIINNAWTGANNGDVYIELGGFDRTGIIYEPVAPEECTLGLVCPENISVPPDAGSCNAVVTYSDPLVTGNCPDITVIQTAGLPSGSSFPAGMTTNTFQASSSEGSTSTCSFTVTVNSLPWPAGSITGPAAVCQGQDAVSYSVAPITNATSYVWAYSGTGATITGTGNAVTISFSLTASSGNLTVYGTNDCGNGNVSPNFAITVNPLPGGAGTITGTSSVCQGQDAVSYSVEPVTNATTYEWVYSGSGATVTGTGSTVTISFSSTATAGNLTVYGTNSCGNGAVSPAYPITVNPLPGVAGTITGTSQVCQGQSDVAYSVAVIPYATDYEWSYSGTGATLTGSGVSVTISFSTEATSGNLTVFGTNSCGNGAASPDFSVTVNTLPVAPVSGGDQETCANQPIPVLTVTVGAGETADWYADATGGTALASGTLSYTPAGAGTFYAEARNVTTGCLSLTRTAVTLTIHPLPAAYAGADQTIPNGTSTTISDATASGAAPLLYSWTPAAAFTDPDILYPTTVNLFSTAIYTLTVTDGNTCVKSDQMTITITGGMLGVNPSAEPDAVCAGEEIQLYASASGGSGTYTYNWSSVPTGFTSSLANPKASPVTTTTYTVVVDDGFTSVSGSVTVTVHPLPAVFAGADRSIPYGTSTTISDATATGAPALSYLWTPAATFADPSLLNPTTVNLTSAQTCVLTATDANGCTQSDVMTITVTGSPLDANPATAPDLVCLGGSTQLTANASGGSGTYTHGWTSNPPGFTSTLADPQATPDVTTTYTVVVDDGFNTATGSVTVTVITLEVTCPDDMEVLLTDPPFALTGGIPAGGTFSGNGVTEGWFDPATAGNGEHIITYAYEDANGCEDFCTFLITVSGSVVSGDANCDGFVNVLDIITIVNYIFELDPVPFCFDEADVNDDLIINVMDVIGTVNIIMGP